MATIGRVQELAKTEFTFEWRIDDFRSLSEEDGKAYYSPHFLIDAEYWNLCIYPNGYSVYNSVGYISIYFHRKSSGPSKSMSYTFNLKTVDGKKYCEKQLSYEFTKAEGHGYPTFLLRSELIEKKCTLLPDGVLTIVCTTESCSKSTTYDAGDTVKVKCSDCKEEFDVESLPSHKHKCLDKPVRCPACNEVTELRKWFDHECSLMRVKANEKLVNDLASICDAQEHSDVTITVKDEEFRLHRNILAGRNPYFKSMLNVQMKEKATGIVSIQDCEPDIFRSFIHFVYTGKVDDLSVENVTALYELSDKYHEDQLKEECLCFMKNAISVESFCDFTVLALRYDEKELLKTATDLFCRETKEIITNVKWHSFIKQYPTQSNELHIKAIDYMMATK